MFRSVSSLAELRLRWGDVLAGVGCGEIGVKGCVGQSAQEGRVGRVVGWTVVF